MSYTKHLPTQYIRVYYSETVSYPASQNGGTIRVSGHVDEPVDVVVHVDTEQFDREVDHCNNSVNLLTGSVVATEGAQVASVRENARRIGDTIITGFFKTVRSDISQQIAALQSNIDSLLIHLRELSNRCLGKQKQMQTDYQRISSRYLKIFDELDSELENRIHAIDEPVFSFSRATDNVAGTTTSEGLVATTSIGNAETSRLHAMISASMSKKRAVEAIGKAEKFLDVQYSADDLLANCLRPGGEQEMVFTPCCLVETTVAPMQFSSQIYSSPLLKDVSRETISRNLEECPWHSRVSTEDATAISGYFNAEVAEVSRRASSPHETRVAQMISRLFDLSGTAAPGI